MRKSYADECLERADKATPLDNKCPEKCYLFSYKDNDIVANIRETGFSHEQADNNYNFYYHARQDVPELARRLKKACQMLRIASQNLFHINNGEFHDIALELEAPMGEK